MHIFLAPIDLYGLLHFPGFPLLNSTYVAFSYPHLPPLTLAPPTTTMRRSILLFRVASSVPFRLYEWPFDSSNVFFEERGENEIPSITVNPEHRSLNDFISPSKTLGADKKGFSSINFRFAFVCRSRARIVADHLERYFGEASSTRISAESNI